MKKLFGGLLVSLAALIAVPAVAGADTIFRDDLAPGQTVDSDDGRYRLAHQHDGNVVLYDDRGQPLWNTETAGTATDRLVFQSDGNLVLYADDGTALWHSGTGGGAGQHLAVQNDANVVVYGQDGTPLWARRGLAPADPAVSLQSMVTVWDRLAQCESGGNWHANTGNGYTGGLQWSHSSWNAFKDPGAPSSAQHASRDQEIAAANNYRAYEQSAGRGGYGPWPSCARKLGLPR